MSKKYKYEKTFTYNGKRYHVYADTQLELGRKIQKKIAALESGSRVVSGDTTLANWAEKCIEAYKSDQSDVTRKKYVNRVKRCILTELGDLPLKRITPMHCQSVMNNQAGKSHTQINEVYQALKFLFRHALANGLIASDPTVHLAKPKAKRVKSRRALTAYERDQVISLASTDRRWYLYLLMLGCGCRPSEAAECKGMDITISEGHPMLHIRGTKTPLSDRLVPIPEFLYALIKDTPHMEYIAQNREGNRITNMDRLWKGFKYHLNIQMGCKTYRNQLIPPYPLAPDLVPYCFRHEFCTNLAREGIDIRIAQRLMGHSDISLTANIYTNFDQSDLIKTAEKIGTVVPGVVPTDEIVEK